MNTRILKTDVKSKDLNALEDAASTRSSKSRGISDKEDIILKQRKEIRTSRGVTRLNVGRLRKLILKKEYGDKIKEVIAAICDGEPKTISFEKFSRIEMSDEAKSALLDRWVNDLERIEAGLPLNAPDTDLQSTDSAGLALSLPEPGTIEDTALYRNRPTDPATGKRQSILDFLRQGWPARYIEAGVLTQRSQLQGRDNTLYRALYETHEGRNLPAHILPTKQQVVDEELSHSDPKHLREAQRLARAQQRRGR
jgi:hypothetical protein